MEENKKPETTSQQDSAPVDYSHYMGTLNRIHPMTLVNDEKSLSGTVSYKYMMLILRTYNGASRRLNLPIKQ